MFEGEFTHQGDRCTFEVLVAHAGFDDPALSAIGEIIHDIDLKDDKYGRAETAGIRSLITGIATPGADDEQRLARGAAARWPLRFLREQEGQQMKSETTTAFPLARPCAYGRASPLSPSAGRPARSRSCIAS